jgi:hypothetical protein
MGAEFEAQTIDVTPAAGHGSETAEYSVLNDYRLEAGRSILRLKVAVAAKAA